MNEIQSILLEEGKYFRDFCNKHNIPYCLVGGNILGSVRHKGFIPWDDDMDFVIPRPHYDRFLKLAKKLDFPYCLRDFSVDKEGHSFCFSKIDNTQTTFIEKSLSNFKHKGGVYIDVFPLDATFDSKILQSIHLFFIDHLVRLREIAYIARIKPEKGWLYNTTLKLLQKTCRGRTLHKIINFVLTLKKYDRANYVGNLVWGYGKKEVLPKSYYEPFAKIEFEKEYFSAPAKVELYLQSIYGDYMTPPPESQRFSQHPHFYLNLTLPYKDFVYDV